MSAPSNVRCSACGHSAGAHDKDGCCVIKDRKLCPCGGFTTRAEVSAAAR